METEANYGRVLREAAHRGACCSARVRANRRPLTVRVFLAAILVTLLLPTSMHAQNVITTIAGVNASGQEVAGVSFNLPTGVAVDLSGNLYVADSHNCVVWQINYGVSTVIAGIANNCTPGTGPSSSAAQSLAYPIDVASCGGNVYFATHGVDPVPSGGQASSAIGGEVFEIAANGTFSTLTMPTPPAQTPYFPVAIACDSNLNVYVSSVFYGAELAFYGSVDEILAGNPTPPTMNLIQAYGSAYPGITVDSLDHVFALEVGASEGWIGTASLGPGYLYELTGGGGSSEYLLADIPNGLPNPARLVSTGAGTFLITAAIAPTSGHPTPYPPTYVFAVPGFGTLGLATAIAGNGVQGYKGDGGQATNAELNNASALAVDTCGSVYVADSGNNVVRKVFNPNTASTAPCTTGSSAPGGGDLSTSVSLTASTTQITPPGTVSLNAIAGAPSCPSTTCTSGLQGEVFFCAFSQSSFVPADATDSTPCETGATLGAVAITATSDTSGVASLTNYSFPIPGTYYVAAEFFDPPFLPSTSAPLTLTVCGSNCTPNPGTTSIPVSTLPVALTPGALSSSYANSGAAAVGANGTVYYLDSAEGTVMVTYYLGTDPLFSLPILSSSTSVVGGGTLGGMPNLGDMVSGPDGNLYITDTGNNRIIKVANPATEDQTVSVITPTLTPPLTAPMGIFETASDELYVTDSGEGSPRVVTFTSTGANAAVLFSSANTGAPALGQLLGLAVNPSTLAIYVANSLPAGSGGNLIKVASGGTASVVSTPGITLQSPYGIAMDPAGGLYFSDTGTHQVYRMDVHGNVIVVAGNGTANESLDNVLYGQPGVSATQTGITSPTWLALDASNSIYISDTSEMLYLNVTQSVVDFTAVGQSQTIYVTNPVAGTQGSVEMELGSPLLYGNDPTDFTVDTTGTCSRTSSNLLSPNTSCTLVVTLNSAASVAKDTACNNATDSACSCTLSEIEASLGPPLASGSCQAPPASLTMQQIFLNAVPAGTSTLQVAGTASQGTYNVLYSPVAFLATGGVGQLMFWEIGSLPQGMTLSSTGMLSGTPLQGGTFPFTINVKDSQGDTGSLTQTLVINPAATSTTLCASLPASLCASPTTITAGQSVTLTASVLYNGSPVTSGSVVFYDSNNNTLGTVPLISSGQASLPTSALNTVGANTFTATFQATANLASSSGTATVTVTSSGSSSCIPSPTTVCISDPETITVTDTPTFADIFDQETITVTDTPEVVAEPAQLSIAAPVAYYSVGSLGFGTVAAGQTATQSFSLANIGDAPLSLTGDSFNSGVSFLLSQTLCTNGASSLPTTLPPLAACVFTISYTAPQSGTPASDAITFADNAALSNASSTGSGSSYMQTIPLNGSGTGTTPGPPPPTTITIPTITESITVTDQVTVPETPVITWATPAPITYGTPLGSAQLDATAAYNGSSVAGTFAYSPAVGTVLGAGTQTLSVTFTPTDMIDYTAATASVSLQVQATQAITATPPAEARDNDSFTVSATGGASGNALVFTSSGDCTNSGATYTMGTKTGTCSGTINQAGNANYLAAPPFTWSTTVIKTLVAPAVTLSVAPNPPNAYGGSSFVVTATYPNTEGVPIEVPTITGAGACSAGAVSGSGTTYQATVTMTKGSGTCTTTAKWAANFYYAAATADAPKITAEQITPTVSLTGAPASAADGSSFTVTATSNETGTYASTPTITVSVGDCKVGSVSNPTTGTYQATVTMTKATGTCTTTAKWAVTIEYEAAKLTQTTTATTIQKTTASE